VKSDSNLEKNIPTANNTYYSTNSKDITTKEPDTLDRIQRKWDNPINNALSKVDKFSLPDPEYEQPNKSTHSEDMEQFVHTLGKNAEKGSDV